jgi:hypothetical protein
MVDFRLGRTFEERGQVLKINVFLFGIVSYPVKSKILETVFAKVPRK